MEKRLCTWVVVVLAFSGMWAGLHAQGLPVEANSDGDYIVPLGGVYDLSGTYFDSAGGISLSYSISQDGDGRITGSGSGSASQYGIRLSVRFTVTGAVKGSGKTLRLTLQMVGEGNATYQGTSLPFRFWANAKAKSQQAGASSILQGSMKVKVCIRGAGCASEKATFQEIVTDDGRWTLTLSLSRDEQDMVGNAQALMGSSAGATYALSGKLNEKKGVAKLKLTPQGGGPGLKLDVAAQAGDGGEVEPAAILQIKGKAFGQKVKQRF